MGSKYYTQRGGHSTFPKKVLSVEDTIVLNFLQINSLEKLQWVQQSKRGNEKCKISKFFDIRMTISSKPIHFL